jgi:ATP-dependent DNA helicase RecG
MAMNTLAQPCTCLKNVGEKTAALLKKCEIFTIQDLVFHLPFRYQDRTRITPINELVAGEHAVIQGSIVEVKTTHGRRPSLICYMSDETGVIALRFFNFNAAQKKQFYLGGELRCFGEIRFWNELPEMIHPEYRRIQNEGIIPLEETLTPIYPSTQGLSQNVLYRLTSEALSWLEKGMLLSELIPSAWLEQLKLPTLAQALRYVHRPPRSTDVKSLEEGSHPAQQRLIVEELLAQHLSLRRVRKHFKLNIAAPLLNEKNTLTQVFLEKLVFRLTGAQERVLQEISADIQQQKPMLRLIQGDVGSGKTVVAALTMLKAVENGFQAALMAPTELLAEQHFRQFQAWFSPLNIEVTYLAGYLSSKLKEQSSQDLLQGKSQIVVGTHALFQKSVDFKSLGVVVIDEQHRFGVDQRLALWQKGVTNVHVPHQLILTATPIPRTLAMVFYADLDVSVIDELPPGRTPITTVVIPDNRRDEVVDRIRQACAQGKQAYWVCPLIDESDILQCQAVEATVTQLRILLPEINIGLVHGRMKPQEKESAMQEFRDGSISVLVATTVIEVGVDVPNASLMIIENAERLGLSQLHQLRGRIGRGAVVSYCVLLYQPPLSPTAQTRLEVIRNSQDGFEIARKDLALRGPGEVLGTKQKGITPFRIVNLVRDQKWLPLVQELAESMLVSHPAHVDALILRWLTGNEKYGLV